MSNEESGQSRPGQQGGPGGQQWGAPQGGQSGAPGQGGQSGPPTNPWPASGGGSTPFGGQSGAGQQGPGQQGPGQQGPGQAPPRPQGQGERPGWGQQPAYGQGPQTGPQQVQSGQPGPAGQPGPQGGVGAQSPTASGTTPAASSGTDNGTLVRIALHVLALLLVVLGISIPMDDSGTLWESSAAWSAFAVVAALAQGAAFFGKPALGGNGWFIGAAGAAGLLLFWTLLMLPMIQTNMAFMVTVGTACAAVAVALSPDRRL